MKLSIVISTLLIAHLEFYINYFQNQILCDLHFADVALMECSDFMQQLRSFKPQSLGCAVARRKSSTTLIFPLPPQACSGECAVFTPPAKFSSTMAHSLVNLRRMEQATKHLSNQVGETLPE